MKCPRLIIKEAGLKADIAQARRDTNTNPSEAQIKAENYKKGSFRWKGLVIKIENPKGSTRSGTDSNGKAWSVTMKYDYGYIGATKSKADGDAVDVFIGSHPESEIVYVIDQMFKGKFDEHKCVIGALTEEEARKTYLANYEKGWKCGPITAMTVDNFKEWVKKGNTGKPVKGQNLFKVSFVFPNIINMSGLAAGATIGGHVSSKQQYKRYKTKREGSGKKFRSYKQYMADMPFDDMISMSNAQAIGGTAGYFAGGILGHVLMRGRAKRMYGNYSGKGRYTSSAFRAGDIKSSLSKLNINKSSIKTKAQLKSEFRKILKKVHPDQGGSNEDIQEFLKTRESIMSSNWFNKLAMLGFYIRRN